MKTLYILPLFVLSYIFPSYGQSAYEKAWQALDKNNRAEAAKYLQKAASEKANESDAYITSLYLATFNGNEKDKVDFITSFYNKVDNPYPYIFSLWFNEALLGDYGKKEYIHQLEIIDKIIKDKKAPGTLVYAADYQKGLHYVYSNQFDSANASYSAIKSIYDWQFTGPFENLSGSGFYKNYGPLEHPEASATFKSYSNADIKWFTPSNGVKEGWTPTRFFFNVNSGILYAQSFVTSPLGQDVFCNIGVCGSIKVWINDKLIFEESKEMLTEMDAYSIKCHLNKGINRILVQLGYTNADHPTFSLRFADINGYAVPGIYGSSSYMPYEKANQASQNNTIIPHFAEFFFLEKIRMEPANYVNYLLLADAYLRNSKVTEARKLLSDIVSKHPSNSLLRMKLIEALLKDGNRTLLLEEVEKLKRDDPESLLAIELKLKEEFQNEKFEDLKKTLRQRLELYGEDISTAGYKVQLIAQEKNYEELVSTGEELYKKYPNNADLVKLMYQIKKDVYRDKNGSIEILKNFFKTNFNYSIYEIYANIMLEDGNEEEFLNVRNKLSEMFPYDPGNYATLADHFYTVKKYKQAEENINKAIALSPYNEFYWKKLGNIKKELNDNNGALDAYNLSLQYDPNEYDVINQIRRLKGKQEYYKLLPEVDIEKLIEEDGKQSVKDDDPGYYYILDQKGVILYPEGASEQYYTYVVRITNEKGVDAYKESSISFGANENLLIEKAEIHKKNNTKIVGERNENEIVFTNLEPGDVIVFKYRTQSYTYGRFSKEFWDQYLFGGNVYSEATRYSILIPEEIKINYYFTNANITPEIRNIEGFKLYTWEMSKMKPQTPEPQMPPYSDVGYNLHISTLNNWNEISNWYSDVSKTNKAEEDPEVAEAFRKIFPNGTSGLSQFAKAKRIYKYIQDNIRYSLVPFRQSAYVPQQLSRIISTRLGDCKDMSSLFVTLSKMADIKSQMVLINTRENGQRQMILPSLEFNHCIVKSELDGQEYFIELTDNYLSFASLPNSLNGAAYLEIPLNPSNAPTSLKFLTAKNRTKDIIRRELNIIPDGENLNISVVTVETGHPASSIRNTYSNLDNERQLEGMENTVASKYANNIKMDTVSFPDLDAENDSIVFTYSFTVKNEVSEIGSMKTFRINYPDVIATLDRFSVEERVFPVDYWSYEDVDIYETKVIITAPEGTDFTEIPNSESYTFRNMKFSINYRKEANKLLVTRTFESDRENISEEEYPAFKNFFEKIIKAERKIIAYK